ncbi:AAA family ATPase [Pseudomonas asiatica]|uniref:AAA family ATPase n=1 Tax=Pseudomonas asiatica TaxID=2219225 RepID=UPI003B931712
MILSFGAKNFWSFKDGFDISFELNSKVPKNVSMGRSMASVIGVKGANSSGKTQILKALDFFNYLGHRTFIPNRNSIFVESFFDNDDPVELYIEFETHSIRYTYEIELTKTEILRETIYKKKSRKTPIIERIKNQITKKTAEYTELDLITLQSHASIINTAPNFKLENIGSDIDNIYEFFGKIRGNVGARGALTDAEIFCHKEASKYYSNVPKALEFTTKILKKCDPVITRIEILNRTDDEGKREYFPIFYCENIQSKKNWLTIFDLSDGTQALFKRLVQYWTVLHAGGVLVMDEFDTHLHPELLPILVDLFTNTDTNPNDAQFIFTSHNLEIIDHLGKYRTVLVDKVNGESYCYRLDEIPSEVIRNDRPISNLYREGKLGGVPKL